MGVIVIGAIIYFVARWCFGGTITSWQRRYVDLIKQQHRGELGINEFIKQSNELWDKYH